ncbi:MAG: hypothetical protein V4663_10595 [Bacteroidota bacterium]
MQHLNPYNHQLVHALNKRYEQGIVVFNRKFTQKNYAIGFTFQSASKDFIN